MGMGHLRRNVLIAEQLLAKGVVSEVLFISGSHEASILSGQEGIDHLTIPGVRRQDDDSYAPRSLGMGTKQLMKLRSETIAAALDHFAPDLLIVDKKPRGVLHELDPALRLLKQRGNTKIVLGLRDILDAPDELSREWDTGGYGDHVKRYFDAVWVYGDPGIYDLATESGLPAQVTERFQFTGYLDQQIRLTEEDHARPALLAECGVDDDPFILCMVGGGEDGTLLADNFVRADLPSGRHGILVTGPFMPAEDSARFHALAAGRKDLHVFDFVKEPTMLIQAAERIICMAGYGSATEVVSLEKPGLLVPRTEPRIEQLIRALRFAERDLVDFLPPDALSPAHLTAWMASELNPGKNARKRIDLGGLERIPQLANELLADRAATPGPVARKATPVTSPA